MNADTIVKTYEALKADRAGTDQLFEDLAHYFFPPETGFSTDDEPHGEKPQPVNAAGPRFVNLLASGLYSNSVNLGEKWFSLKLLDKKNAENPAVKRWLDGAADTALDAIQNSSFSLQAHTMLVNYCAMGTGVLACEMEDGRLMFNQHHIGECHIAEGPDGVVDSLYRGISYTSKQAVQKFGDDCPRDIAAAMDNPAREGDRHEFLHAIFPRDYRKSQRRHVRSQQTKRPEEKPWGSVYIHLKDKTIVRESGYDEFPFAVPRFSKLAREVYGRGPAHMALPTARMVNRAEEDIVAAVEMAVNPPVFMPDDEQISDLDLTPGGVNYYNAQGGGQPVFYSGGNPQLGRDYLMDKEGSIRETFFVDLFLALEQQKNMTAREVVERINEKIEAIAPVVSRLHVELFEVVVTRVVNLLVRDGQIAPPPPDIVDAPYRIIYATRLDGRLKQHENQSILAGLEQAAGAIQALQFRELGAILKPVDLVYRILENNRIPRDLMFDLEEAQERFDEMQEAAAAAAQAAQVADKIKPVDMQRRAEQGAPIEALGPAGAETMGRMI